MPILKVVVRLETLPLPQLLMRVHPTMIHKIAEDVQVLNGWTKTRAILELAIIPRRERVICDIQSKYLKIPSSSIRVKRLFCSLIFPYLLLTLTFPIHQLSHQRNDAMRFSQLTFLQNPAQNPLVLKNSPLAITVPPTFWIPHLFDHKCL